MAGMMQGGGPPMPPGQMVQGMGDPGLDTAQTAMAPQAGDPDDETFTAIVAGLRAHVFGKGEPGIVEAIKSADDPGRVMGEMVFALVREAAKQAEAAGKELDMNILMGAATELIDDISDLMQAHGFQLDDQAREYALLYAQQLYVESADPSTEDRRAAQQQLGQYQQSGAVDQTVKYVQMRGMQNGTDPFGVQQMKPGMMEGGEK